MAWNFSKPLEAVKSVTEAVDAKTLTFSTLISAAMIILPAWLYLNETFAHADDVKQIQNSSYSQIMDLRLSIVEDKIFELKIKGKLTTTEKALLDRYQAQREKLIAISATSDTKKNTK
jgi:hypothetical protein